MINAEIFFRLALYISFNLLTKEIAGFLGNIFIYTNLPSNSVLTALTLKHVA